MWSIEPKYSLNSAGKSAIEAPRPEQKRSARRLASMTSAWRVIDQ